MLDNSLNPYAPPTTHCDGELIPAIREGLHLRTRWLRLVIACYAFVTLAGVAIAAHEIESIMGSGPLLLLLGSALVVLAFRNRNLHSSLLGFSAF